MKKSDLKTGMRVRVRNGGVYLVIKDVDTMLYGHQDIAFVNNISFICGNDYTEDLKDNNNLNYDIVEVFQVNHDEKSLLTYAFLDLKRRFSIWKRQEYTEEQKEIFMALKVLEFNYIARDSKSITSSLCAYAKKPTKGDKIWLCNLSNRIISITTKDDIFDFLKWEDEEPFEIPTL